MNIFLACCLFINSHDLHWREAIESAKESSSQVYVDFKKYSCVAVPMLVLLGYLTWQNKGLKRQNKNLEGTKNGFRDRVNVMQTSLNTLYQNKSNQDKKLQDNDRCTKKVIQEIEALIFSLNGFQHIKTTSEQESMVDTRNEFAPSDGQPIIDLLKEINDQINKIKIEVKQTEDYLDAENSCLEAENSELQDRIELLMAKNDQLEKQIELLESKFALRFTPLRPTKKVHSSRKKVIATLSDQFLQNMVEGTADRGDDVLCITPQMAIVILDNFKKICVDLDLTALSSREFDGKRTEINWQVQGKNVKFWGSHDVERDILEKELLDLNDQKNKLQMIEFLCGISVETTLINS